MNEFHRLGHEVEHDALFQRAGSVDYYSAAERRRNRSALGDAVMHHGVGQPHGIGLDELEGILVQQTLLFYSGNRTRAAQSLGVARTTLYRMMKRHGLATGCGS